MDNRAVFVAMLQRTRRYRASMDAGLLHGTNSALVGIRRRFCRGDLPLRCYTNEGRSVLAPSSPCYEAMLITCREGGRKDSEDGPDCPNNSALAARTQKGLKHHVERESSTKKRRGRDIAGKFYKKRGLQPIETAKLYTCIVLHEKVTPSWMQASIHGHSTRVKVIVLHKTSARYPQVTHWIHGAVAIHGK